jgi:TetR/AcrR family transcriptional regulator of autoinduction and epiphytic fitness
MAANRGRPSKKSKIIASAGELFCELGYQGTSIDLVVQKADVSKPTVYNNFPSKLLLYAAWQTSELSKLKKALLTWCESDAWEQEAGSINALYAFWVGYFEALFQGVSFISITRIVHGEPYKLTSDIVSAYRVFIEEIHEQASEFANSLHFVSDSHAKWFARTVFQRVLSKYFMGQVYDPSMDLKMLSAVEG